MNVHKTAAVAAAMTLKHGLRPSIGRAGGRWGLVAAPLLLLSASGCASVRTPPAGLASSGGPTTVRVRNEGASAMTIYSQAGATALATVQPGGTRCVRITTTSEQDQLVAEPAEGGISTTSDSFTVRPGDGWTWTVPAGQDGDAELVPSRPCTLPTATAP